MGLWDRLLSAFGHPSSYMPAQIAQRPQLESYYSTAGLVVSDPATPIEYYIQSGELRSGVSGFWGRQPNLRKVVGFIARSVASIPLNAYERVSDTERQRLRGEPLTDLLRNPSPRMSAFRFWEALITDGLLYDRWCFFVDVDAESPRLIRVPAHRLKVETSVMGNVDALRAWSAKESKWVELPLDYVVFDVGYSPTGGGLSMVDTLRDILLESEEAILHRREIWSNGARIPGYISRPQGTPWDTTKRDRFVQQLRAAFGRGGTSAGGLPLLEDGMEIKSTSVFSAKDTEEVKARELTAVEVASAYHIAPELVGARQGTYSNVDAFRQMLYGPSLGPYIDAWQGALNAMLAPMFAGGRNVYIEANVESKLRGSFLEQARIMQSATGGPWMTRNEARAMQNRPPIDGADELIVPLNVVSGGQASPTDSGTQNEGER